MPSQKSSTKSRNKGIDTSLQKALPLITFNPTRSVEYFGVVNYATTERVIEEITKLVAQDPFDDVYLTVTSAGGPTGTAMSFYDYMRFVLKAPLITIGGGDVDSSGIIIFLSGEKRFITKNTTLLLHRAGRIFEAGKRYTAGEIEAMYREDNLKDFQYASVLAERSNGRLTPDKVLSMMESNVILTPVEMVALGLAHAVID